MILIILISKVSIFLLRLLHLGGGTALPGLLIEKIFPSYVAKLTRNFKTIIIISGTNGKTTTQTFLKHLYEEFGYTVTANISGANLLRGIAAKLLEDSNIFGTIQKDVGIFEVEEATMPIITKYISSTYIIVTNLFRDQLDAYGEVVTTRKYILGGIMNSPSAMVVINKDDPNVASIANEISNNILYFSIKDSARKDIFFERPFIKKKKVKDGDILFAENIIMNSDLSTSFDVISHPYNFTDLQFSSPGIHNVYNAIAALCIVRHNKDCTNKKVRNAFASFNPAFGRGEEIILDNKILKLLLIKNPAGFSATNSMLSQIKKLNILIIINDNIADGRDVSWLWDAKVEILADADIHSIVVSGLRSKDMYLRLKYAGCDMDKVTQKSSIKNAIKSVLDACSDGETIYVLPTYTAMLRLRDILSKKVTLQKMWE